MAQPEQNGGHALSEKTSRRSQQPPKKPSAFKKLLAKGPPWLGESLQSPRAWKNFVRSMVAMFAMMVIMVDRKSE